MTLSNKLVRRLVACGLVGPRSGRAELPRPLCVEEPGEDREERNVLSRRKKVTVDFRTLM